MYLKIKRILSGVILFIGVLAVLAPGRALRAASAEDTYRKAISFYQNGNYKKAQKYLKKMTACADEACVRDMPSDMEQAYGAVLETFRGKEGEGGYVQGFYLTDIDKDNSAELIVDFGTSEADRQAYVYQFQNGQAVGIGAFDSGHSTFYFNPCGNGLIGQRGIMSYESIYNVEIQGKELKITYWNSEERRVKAGKYLYLPYALDDHTKYGAYRGETYVDYELKPAQPRPVGACPGVQQYVELGDFDSNYSEYDITGDGMADSLDTAFDGYDDYFSRCRIYINGKPALSQDIYPALGAKFYRIELKNGTIYLAAIAWTDNGDLTSADIYQYKQRSLVKVASLNDNMKKIGFHNTVEDISASGNTVVVKYSLCSHTLGGIYYQRKYRFKNGKLTASVINSKITGWKKQKKWTAKESLSVYKSVSAKKVIATIQKGEKVKIDKMYVNKKLTGCFFRVRTSGGKVGWIKGSTEAIFKEAYYYG